jgi:lysyl-tRNA synthetase class 1
MLLNLASVVNASEPDVLWAFIQRYKPAASPESTPFLAKLVDHAVRYYRDRVAPTKSYRAPTEAEIAAFTALDAALAEFEGKDTPAEDLQTAVFTVGKGAGYENLREWFQALYQVLLGQDQGPRFGSFIALYGVAETRALLQQGIKGELAA